MSIDNKTRQAQNTHTHQLQHTQVSHIELSSLHFLFVFFGGKVFHRLAIKTLLLFEKDSMISSIAHA